MTTRTGFPACDRLRDAEGDIRPLLEALGNALALADLADVDLAAIHIANAIHAAEQFGFVRAASRSGHDIAAAGGSLTESEVH